MAVVRASCPTCGDIELAVGDITITAGPAAAYQFTCPRCRAHVAKPACLRTIDLLACAGAATIDDHVARFAAQLDDDQTTARTIHQWTRP